MFSVESFESVDVLDCVFELVFKLQVVADNVTDALVWHRVIHLELIKQLSRLAIEQAFALQVLLIVVHFQFVVLQQVLFPVDYVL